MRLAIFANDNIREELKNKGFGEHVEVTWVNNCHELALVKADGYFDLLFEQNNCRVEHLSGIEDKPIFVNAVYTTLAEIGRPYIRINGWPGFLKRSICEISTSNAVHLELAQTVFEKLQWQWVSVPDVPGLIAARVVSMIVNEAYFALGEGVSTKSEIDIALKAGTNYPWGPFEWSAMIGLHNIGNLLTRLDTIDERYRVAPTLLAELH